MRLSVQIPIVPDRDAGTRAPASCVRSQDGVSCHHFVSDMSSGIGDEGFSRLQRAQLDGEALDGDCRLDDRESEVRISVRARDKRNAALESFRPPHGTGDGPGEHLEISSHVLTAV